MNMLSSRNPDMKINATAAIESSKKKAVNLNANPMRVKSNEMIGNGSTIDLKFCLIYFHKATADEFRGKINF